MKYIVLVFILFYITTFSQEIPPIQVYNTDDYNAGNQNWMISQSSDKLIYIANNEGLLQFNGAKWTLYPSPNKTIIRSVKVVDELIYTGCFMEFGYWKNNKYGVLEYNSLVPNLKKKMLEDEQIWNIIEFDNWVLFQSSNRIYKYNPTSNQIDIVESDDIILKLYHINNDLYYHSTNNSIFKIVEGKAALFIKNDFFTKNSLVNIFSFDGKLLFLTKKSGFFFYKKKKFIKWNNHLNKTLKTLAIYSSIHLDDDSFILGTISNGIVHISSDGKIKYHLKYINGLSNNTVLSLFLDVNSNVWLGLDNGVNVINIKSPISIYKDFNGVLGTVYCTKIYDKYLYLGTNQGLFYKKNNSLEKFKLFKGTKGQVWSLSIFDNKLFCGHHLGTFIINNNESYLLKSNFGTWDVKKIPNKPKLLLQGTYNGFYVLNKVNTKWKVQNKIKGFDISARFFEYYSESELFVNHEYKGLYKLSLNKDYSKIINTTIDTTIIKGKNSSIALYKNEVLYANKDGVYYKLKENDSFKKDSLLSKLIEGSNYNTGKMVIDKSKNLWLFGNKSIYNITPNKLNNSMRVAKIPISKKLRKGMIGFENLIEISKNQFLIGVSDGYLKLNLSKIDYSISSLHIDKMKSKTKNGIEKLVAIENEISLKNNQNIIEFEFSVPNYDTTKDIEYQCRLDGFEDGWSAFSNTANITYKNLPYNDYTFNVRARVGEDLTIPVVVNFKIKKPWYLSYLMLLVYFLLTLLLFISIDKIYKWQFKRQFKHDLLKKEQIIMSIKNEKLNLDIESRNRELAISAMSLLRKNKVLSNIKKELVEKEKNKVVIALIEKSLNNEKDWKYFERAFNKADKNFFDKIKSVHPNLTANDLRFCAFLRLNLTSKELAPLLNISYRSVDIKKYRLRKKMNLTEKEGLVDHILNL